MNETTETTSSRPSEEVCTHLSIVCGLPAEVIYELLYAGWSYSDGIDGYPQWSTPLAQMTI
jgi:hypothetical protein